MTLTDEKIKQYLQKNISSKSILVKKEELEEVIKTHEDQGFKLINKSVLNGRFKLTFQRIN